MGSRGRPWRPSQRRPVAEPGERPEVPAEVRRALDLVRSAVLLDRIRRRDSGLEDDWAFLAALRAAGFRYVEDPRG